MADDMSFHCPQRWRWDTFKTKFLRSRTSEDRPCFPIVLWFAEPSYTMLPGLVPSGLHVSVSGSSDNELPSVGVGAGAGHQTWFLVYVGALGCIVRCSSGQQCLPKRKRCRKQQSASRRPQPSSGIVVIAKYVQQLLRQWAF